MEDKKKLFSYDLYYSKPAEAYFSNLFDVINIADYGSATAERRLLIKSTIRKETFAIIFGDEVNFNFDNSTGKIKSANLEKVKTQFEKIKAGCSAITQDKALQVVIKQVIDQVLLELSSLVGATKLSFYESCTPKNRVFQFNAHKYKVPLDFESFYAKLASDGYIKCGKTTFCGIFKKPNQFELKFNELKKLPSASSIAKVEWLGPNASLAYFLSKLKNELVKEQKSNIFSCANDLMQLGEAPTYRLTNLEKVPLKRVGEKHKKYIDAAFDKL